MSQAARNSIVPKPASALIIRPGPRTARSTTRIAFAPRSAWHSVPIPCRLNSTRAQDLCRHGRRPSCRFCRLRSNQRGLPGKRLAGLIAWTTIRGEGRGPGQTKTPRGGRGGQFFQIGNVWGGCVTVSTTYLRIFTPRRSACTTFPRTIGSPVNRMAIESKSRNEWMRTPAHYTACACSTHLSAIF